MSLGLANILPASCVIHRALSLSIVMKFTPAKPPLTGETLDSLTARLVDRGEPGFRAKQILDWLYKKRVRSWDEMTNLSKPLRTWLAETFDLLPADLVLNKQSEDVTDKLLLELRDQSLIETVIIRVPQEGVGLDHSRKTICISTQVGCAMACVFCASGLAGGQIAASAGVLSRRRPHTASAHGARFL